MTVLVTPHVAQQQHWQHHMWHNNSASNTMHGTTTVLATPHTA